MNHPEINIGIDTSLSQLDIGVRPTGEFFSVSNNDSGIKDAIKQIKNSNLLACLLKPLGGKPLVF